jgi:predicted RNase H-like HicB family nuclease
VHVKYAIVIEKTDSNYSAYVPDLPGCASTGSTIEEVEESIREAIAVHIEGLREDGEEVPPASSRVEYVEVVS